MRDVMPVWVTLDRVVQITAGQLAQHGLAGAPFSFRIRVFRQDGLLELLFEFVVSGV
jgi:hypothetical protein